MADVAAEVAAPVVEAPAAATKGKKAAKPKAPKAPKAPKEKKAPVKASHPPFASMIVAAIKALKDRKGASKQAILKYIQQNYKVDDNVNKVNSRLKIALKSGVTGGSLKQAAGTGAAGRFRIAEAEAKPKAVKKAPAAKKAPKPKTEKSAAKPKAKKASKPKAEKKAKSPKKVAKKTVAKKPAAAKKAKSPKKPVAKKASKPKVAKA